MNYLQRYQKWTERGQVGSIFDSDMSDDNSSHE
jgi:hypothetical protein